jgi:hypothetical protein
VDDPDRAGCEAAGEPLDEALDVAGRTESRGRSLPTMGHLPRAIAPNCAVEGNSHAARPGTGARHSGERRGWPAARGRPGRSHDRLLGVVDGWSRRGRTSPPGAAASSAHAASKARQAESQGWVAVTGPNGGVDAAGVAGHPSGTRRMMRILLAGLVVVVLPVAVLYALLGDFGATAMVIGLLLGVLDPSWAARDGCCTWLRRSA